MTIKVARTKTCPTCDGSGYSILGSNPERWDENCWRCHGTGEVKIKDRAPVQMDWHWSQAEVVELRS